jgi:hypothetical protein
MKTQHRRFDFNVALIKPIKESRICFGPLVSLIQTQSNKRSRPMDLNLEGSHV